MGGLSLLAASLVVAALGFGWVNAIKDGVFDIWSSVKRIIFVVQDESESESVDTGDDGHDAMMEDSDAMKDDDAMMEGGTDIEGTIETDPEYDQELNDLESELDTLLNESEAELDALEGDL